MTWELHPSLSIASRSADVGGAVMSGASLSPSQESEAAIEQQRRRKAAKERHTAKFAAYGRRKQRDPCLDARLALAGLCLQRPKVERGSTATSPAQFEDADEAEGVPLTTAEEVDHGEKASAQYMAPVILGGMPWLESLASSMPSVARSSTPVRFSVSGSRPSTTDALHGHTSMTNSIIAGAATPLDIAPSAASTTPPLSYRSSGVRQSRASSIGTLLMRDGLFPTPPNRSSQLVGSSWPSGAPANLGSPAIAQSLRTVCGHGDTSDSNDGDGEGEGDGDEDEDEDVDRSKTASPLPSRDSESVTPRARPTRLPYLHDGRSSRSSIDRVGREPNANVLGLQLRPQEVS